MADLTNRSRFRVSVKNRDELTAHFPFNKLPAVEACITALKEQGFKPRVEQLDESWLVRIREKGHTSQSVTFKSRAEAEAFILQTSAERQRGLFVDYSVSRKVSLADLMVRYLLEEAPHLKSHQIIAYTLEGWLADSGTEGVTLLQKYREELRKLGKPVRAAKFQMRKSNDELAWIHKPFSEIKTVDILGFMRDRLEVVKPGTVDRELDRLRAVFKVATVMWDYPLSKNPMVPVRVPPYFNERDRRVSESEERRLLEALADLDYKRAVDGRLDDLVNEAMVGLTFSSNSSRKKVLADMRSELRPVAEETAEVQPYLQVFYLFQVMTAARRGETMALPWKHIDFEAGTAFLPETKNGRARKLSLRSDLLELLKMLPSDTNRVFAVGLDHIVHSWELACAAAGIEDLHIHDLRHEALSRVAEMGAFELPQLKQFSGHRDTRMLMRYAHLCASRLAKKLDECYQDATKYRVHRGRKFLNKEANLPPSSVTRTVDEPASEVEATSVPGSASTQKADQLGTHTTVTASSAAIADDNPAIAPTRSAAKVIAFPPARMVGNFGEVGTTDEQHQTPIAQVPSAG